MTENLLLSGMFIGFFTALPFGGNAVLCTKNTLSYGGKSGISTGLGAATAHATYSFIGLSGLVASKALLSKYLGLLELIGGLFLCYVGISSLFQKISSIDSNDTEKQALVKTYIMSTLFALTNPKSIIVAAILITESGVLSTIEYFQTIPLILIILGVFMGSTLWWLVLVVSLSFLKKILARTHLIFLNRASGFLVILCGVLFSIFGLSKILR